MLNKKFLISVATAAVIFSGCGDDKSTAQSTVAPVAQEEVKTEVVSEATEQAQIAQEEQLANETEETATQAVEEAVQEAQEVVENVAQDGVLATQEIVEETTQAVEETVQEAQEVAEEVVAQTQEVVEQAKEEVSQQVEAAIQTVEETTQAVVASEAPAVQESAPAIDAAPLYVKCIACHGANAEKVALGKSAIIKDWNATQIAEALKGYKAGTYGGAMKGVMVGQVSTLTEEQIDALAEHIAAF